MGPTRHINAFNNSQQRKEIKLIRKRITELQQNMPKGESYQNMYKDELYELTSQLNKLLPKKVIKSSVKNYIKHYKNGHSKESPEECSDRNFMGSPNESSSEHVSPLHFSNESKIPTGFTPCGIGGNGTCCKDKKQNGLISTFYQFFNR
jgi:hypothetical protein